MALFWEEPSCARFLKRLASFSRLILFDKRGTGSSDRSVEIPIIEQQIDDLTSVMDSVGSERAALLGASEGGSLCTLFAATHPERTSALILCGAVATTRWSPETPWAPTRETFETWIKTVGREWGRPLAIELFAPSVAHDKRFRDWWARLLRLAASPAAAIALLRMLDEIDVRPVLPTIRVQHSSSNVLEIVSSTSRTAATSVGTFRMPSTLSCPAPITSPTWATPTRSWQRSRSSSPALDTHPRRTGCWRRCSSPISSAPPPLPPGWATSGGATCSEAIRRSYAGSWPDPAAGK